MRIFVHEHVCGGGMAGAPLPGSLRREGWAMLRSIVEDLSRVNSIERVVTTLDPRLEDRLGDLARQRVEVVPAPLEIEPLFGQLAAASDATLVIAPELDGIHLKLTRRAASRAALLLGSPPAAVELAADKLALSRVLAARGVPALPLEPVDLNADPPAGAAFPAVLKPRSGAGSQWTYLIRECGEAPGVFRAARAEGAPADMVLGPYVKGLPASASFLAGPGGAVPLLAGRQLLSDDGRFSYLGGRLPLPADQSARALRLGGLALEALPGARGFLGVDLILDPLPGPDGPHDFVVEVNARLTTSYLGLRRLARANLASVWLDLACGVDVAMSEWYFGAVSFRPEGDLDPGSVLGEQTR